MAIAARINIWSSSLKQSFSQRPWHAAVHSPACARVDRPGWRRSSIRSGVSGLTYLRCQRLVMFGQILVNPGNRLVMCRQRHGARFLAAARIIFLGILQPGSPS